MSVVANVRALFRQFRNSDVRVMHVVAGGYDVFFSRDAAMRSPAGLYTDDNAASADARQSIEMRAPHLGTVVSLASPGTLIEAQGAFGRMLVLDLEEDLISPHAGRVVERRAEPGALAEYDDILILLEPS